MPDRLTPNGRFEYCIAPVLEHEGGLSEDKRDPGGTTQWGISLRFAKQHNIDIDDDGDTDEIDIKSLTVKQAKELYRRYWWDRYRYFAFNDIDVAAKVLDLSVNMGANGAHKVLQRAINSISQEKIKVDGILGGQTFGAANSADPKALRIALREAAKQRYLSILQNNPNMEWARNGWLRRAAW